MCGLTAVLFHPQSEVKPLGPNLRTALSRLQHRGYDGAGIAISGPNRIVLKKGYGLISEVLTHDLLSELPIGEMGLAHTRYKTVGECTAQASQPLLNQDHTLCLVHNGQIDALDESPDSTKILRELCKYLYQSAAELANVTDEQIQVAIQHVFQTIIGAYSCVLMIQGLGLVAFRDPRGIRPLVYSQNAHGDHFLASEDVAIRAVDSFRLSLVQDILPGECCIIRTNGTQVNRQQLIPNPCYTPCIFEYIYLAHLKSTINGIEIKTARKKLGQLLATQIKMRSPVLCSDIDWIVPVPETSCPASQEMALTLQIPYLEILKLDPNRKKARTFILPTQDQREKAVSQKFTLDKDPIVQQKLVGSHILLVDDSIVRGTTLRCVIKMMRDAGVKHVSVASVAPPVRYKNIYGIDIPNDKLLIANGRNLIEIAQELKADRVIYQHQAPMVESFLEDRGF